MTKDKFTRLKLDPKDRIALACEFYAKQTICNNGASISQIMADYADHRTSVLIEENKILREAISLRDCVECGICAFEISPLDSADGFCWNCHKWLRVTCQALGDDK